MAPGTPHTVDSMILNDLDDFILPSQVCVNPLVGTTTSAAPAASSDPSQSTGGVIRLDLTSSDLTSLAYEADPTPLSGAVGVIKSKAKDDVKIATISLSDCLACSGCVTSAEEVLIQEQSYQRLVDLLHAGGKCVVVTLSPQTVASIASLLDMSLVETFVALASMLKRIGVRYVLDASAGGDVSLVESGHEFLRRYHNGRKAEWATPGLSMAVSATRVSKFNPDTAASVVESVSAEDLQQTNMHLPMLCSHCPGWVCYAEKTSPQALPYIDTTKSAQQIIGSIIKHTMTSKLIDNKEEEIFHVAVMPCFDKKLEATRKDFYHEDTDKNEVDLVLSTVELINCLVGELSTAASTVADTGASHSLLKVFQYLKTEEKSPLVLDPVRGTDAFEFLFRCASPDGSSLVAAADANNGSGGYLEYMFRFANEQLNGIDLWNIPLEYKAGRNEDISELTTDLVPAGGHNLTFAKAYGFRNIQSVMMKMKTKRCKLDFVEIMACPKGCMNGGGQYKSVDRETPLEIRDRVAIVSNKMGSVLARRPAESPLVQWLYSLDGLNAGPCSLNALETLHTRYHAIPKLEQIAPLVAKW